MKTIPSAAQTRSRRARARWLLAVRQLLIAVCAVSAMGAAAELSAQGQSQAAQSATRRKVIIDQDAFAPAGSNMQAILMLLQSKDVEVLGITIPSGDGWRDEEVSNTLRLLEIVHRTDIPVYAGAVYPLLNSAARTKLWERVYGKLVYKGAWTEAPPAGGAAQPNPYHPTDPYLIPPSPAGEPSIKAAQQSAVNFLVHTVHQYPGEVTIIAAGPLTNLALAARLDPQFAGLARELVFMGGSFDPIPNDTPFAAEYANSPRREFNMRFDPEAASLVLHEPWKKITEVPVDPTTRTMFKPEFIREVAAGRAPFAAYIGKFGKNYPMWDELAVAVWLDPSLVTSSKMLFVDVDTSFTAGYGQTLSWTPDEAPGLGERMATVVFDVDVPRFEKLTLDLLKAPAPPR